MPEPDVPLRHRLEFLGFLLIRGVARILPERLALGAGALLGRIAGSLFRIRRRVTDENLRLAFPDRGKSWRDAVARTSYRHLGREAVSLLRLLRESPQELRKRTEMVGLEELESALGRGRGAVLVTGHFGNWEIGGACLAVRGIPLDVVAFRQANRLFDRALCRARARLGMTVVRQGHAPSRVPRALREGRVVGLVGDQNWRSSGIFVDFFDVPASTARGPALFALRAGAPLFVGFARALPGPGMRYEVKIEAVPFEPTGDLHEDLEQLTRKFTRQLEETVRGAPEQYFWQHKRWKTRPPAEARAAADSSS